MLTRNTTVGEEMEEFCSIYDRRSKLTEKLQLVKLKGTELFRECGLEFKKSAWVLIKQCMRIRMGFLYLGVQYSGLFYKRATSDFLLLGRCEPSKKCQNQ